MNKHLKMDERQSDVLADMAQGTVGREIARSEGPLKVSGRAVYAAESGGGTEAVGVLVRATIANGRVASIDAGDALALEGVLRVITDSRMVRRPAQGTANAAPAQDTSQVDHFGQPVALVVADTFEQARHAAHLLDIRYEVETADIDPETAREVETPDGKRLEQGAFDTAMDDAAASIDAIYTTPSQSAAPMEPHAALARWDGDRLTLHGAYQILKYNRNELADALGIHPDNVRIVSRYVGGGFGSKLGIGPEAVAAAIAARAIGRPVRVLMSRAQVFEMTSRRSETWQRVRLAADREGRLTAIGHDARVSNLPGEAFSEPVQIATHFLYGGANRHYETRVARLNRTCAGSMRAPGEAVGMLALENAMDELAHHMGLDPVELRLRNIPERHPENGKPFSSRGLADCLTTGADIFGWNRRDTRPGARREGEWLVGLGMASAARSNILSEAQARVRLNTDGTATVQTDMTDIGTGTYSILGQVAGEMLGLAPENVTVELGDTTFPPGSGSGGSWGAGSVGSAVFLACQDIRAALAARLGCDPGEMTLKDGVATVSNRQTRLSDLVDEAMEATGHIEPGDTKQEMQQAAFGAHFAEVAVNSVTGETRVRRMLGVFAAGRILNLKTARSQCFGGMIFGIGAALTENLVHDPRDGHVVNRDLAEYHVPVNLDVPRLDVAFLEERDPWANPIQTKGIGELGISGAGAAVTNAIFNATGIRVRDYPVTLDKLLPGLPG